MASASACSSLRSRTLKPFILIALPLLCHGFQRLQSTTYSQSHGRLLPSGTSQLPSLWSNRVQSKSNFKSPINRPSTQLFQSSEVKSDEERKNDKTEVGDKQQYNEPVDSQKSTSSLKRLSDFLQNELRVTGKRPPIQVEDFDVLFYDVFLIVNLATSICFWTVHRMDFNYIGAAFNEGCLFSLVWIAGGLYTGAFLNSAVDGHWGSADTERGGPKGAGLLAAHTFVNAVNLRLLFALIIAAIEHRPVGSALGEQIMPLEIGFGFIMMVAWRAVHSSFVPRM